MKIVLVNSHLGYGGAERVITLMANYWAEQGHDVYLMTLARRDVPCAYPLHVLVNRVSAQDGTRHRFVLLKLFDFRKNLGRLSPDIVISFQDETNIMTRLVSLGLDLPLIISERSHPQYLPLAWYWKLARRLVYPLCDCLVVQTKSIHDWFMSRKYDLSIEIIPNPLLNDDNRTDFDAEIILDKNAIITVGRLTKAKGHDRLLEIFKKVSSLRPDWKLYIVGEGNLRTRLEEKIQDYGLNGKVILTGHVKNPLSLLKQAKIFVFTSYWEGFPNALCEAMAAGLPVLSFDCPSGPADIIVNGKNGVLISSQEHGAFVESLIELIDCSQKANKLGANARQITANLSVDSIMKKWAEMVSRYIQK
ncbi:MAG: glycosyltransferase family 4 protein [Desulforegulaceae bacterium]|nr:glycosyltransferase family 4 protein [Desulforegulaceae bacterium]